MDETERLPAHVEYEREMKDLLIGGEWSLPLDSLSPMHRRAVTEAQIAALAEDVRDALEARAQMLRLGDLEQTITGAVERPPITAEEMQLREDSDREDLHVAVDRERSRLAQEIRDAKRVFEQLREEQAETFDRLSVWMFVRGIFEKEDVEEAAKVIPEGLEDSEPERFVEEADEP
jgi:hypothetical protein